MGRRRESTEQYRRHAPISRTEPYESADEWIDVFRNHQRIDTTLGGLSPAEYELALAARGREAAKEPANRHDRTPIPTFPNPRTPLFR